VPAQVRGVAGDNDDVSRPRCDFLLAARAEVGLAGLRWVDPPDVEAEGFTGGGQVRDLLQFLELERRAYGATPASTASGGRASHS